MAQLTSYAEYLEKLQRETKKFTNRKKVLFDRLVELQQTCPHENLAYVPDYSGGRDDYYECKHCGKHV